MCLCHREGCGGKFPSNDMIYLFFQDTFLYIWAKSNLVESIYMFKITMAKEILMIRIILEALYIVRVLTLPLMIGDVQEIQNPIGVLSIE